MKEKQMYLITKELRQYYYIKTNQISYHLNKTNDFAVRRLAERKDHRYYDVLGTRLAHGTCPVFLANGYQDKLCSDDTFSLFHLLYSISTVPKADNRTVLDSNLGEAMAGMYPNMDKSYIRRSVLMFKAFLTEDVMFTTDKTQSLKLSDVSSNVHIRLKESIFQNGYVYTPFFGKTDYQERMLRSALDADDIAPFKIQTVKLSAFIFKMMEELFYAESDATNYTSDVELEEQYQVTSKDNLRKIAAAVAHACTNISNPLRFVVLKGTHILAAYSNKTSLTESCMQNIVPVTFLNYMYNKDSIRILVGIDGSNKVRIRRLIYKLDNSDGLWYAGRIYATDGSLDKVAHDLIDNLYKNKDQVITLPTVGDCDIMQFLSDYEDRCSSELNKDRGSKGTDYMHRMCDYYVIDNNTKYEDEEYRFVDTTSTPNSPQGSACRIKDNKYAVTLRIPIQYGEQSLLYINAYYDDLIENFGGQTFRIDKHADTSELYTLSATLGISNKPKDDRLNAYTISKRMLSGNYGMTMEDRDGYLLYASDINNLITLYGGAIRSGLSQVYQCIDRFWNRKDTGEFVMVSEPDPELGIGDADEISLYNISENGTDDIIFIGNYFALSKSYLHYDMYTESLCFFSPKSWLSIKPEKFCLEIVNSATDEDSDIDKFTPVKDTGCLFPHYDELKKIAGVDSLPIRFNPVKDPVYANVWVEKRPQEYERVEISKRVADKILAYDLITITSPDFSAEYNLPCKPMQYTYGITDTYYVGASHSSDKYSQLAEEFYGKNVFAIKDQAIETMNGIVLKIHARKLADGTLVYKNIQQAMKVLNKFNVVLEQKNVAQGVKVHEAV